MAAETDRLQNFPISWFAMIMGLAGFTIAWSRAEQLLGIGAVISPGLRWLTTILFVVLALIYLLKCWRFPRAVIEEVNHPVKAVFMPTISMALLLLSIVYLHEAKEASFWLWTCGATLHLMATLFVMSSWIHHAKYEIAHLNPAWFIPVVGNILVPISGVAHGYAEISWVFFSIGVFFWPVLTAIIFYRLIFHGSLPERLMPTLFIFIAPPAVAFISYLALAGGMDAFARILYGIALFFTLLLLAQIRQFVGLKFFLSWWAYSFPIAAMTTATMIMAQATGQTLYAWLAYGLLAVLSVLILMLLGRTAIAVARREICVAGH